MAELCVLVDTDVILDVLAHRQPFYPHAAGVWAAVENGRVRGLVAAHSVTNLHYLIARHTSRQKAILAVADLLRVFSAAAVDQTVLYQALALGWADFEDAVQACAAAQAGAQYLVTRNAADYPAAPLPVLSPQDFLNILKAE
jgi:predicted nucleic acid-binding protein